VREKDDRRITSAAPRVVRARRKEGGTVGAAAGSNGSYGTGKVRQHVRMRGNTKNERNTREGDNEEGSYKTRRTRMAVVELSLNLGGPGSTTKYRGTEKWYKERWSANTDQTPKNCREKNVISNREKKIPRTKVKRA